ncbi:MAG: hypothetical protein WDZ45_02135 [Flavobacteriaceae bacterium]
MPFEERDTRLREYCFPFAHLWCLNALPISETAELGGLDFGDGTGMIAQSKKPSG